MRYLDSTSGVLLSISVGHEPVWDREINQKTGEKTKVLILTIAGAAIVKGAMSGEIGWLYDRDLSQDRLNAYRTMLGQEVSIPIKLTVVGQGKFARVSKSIAEGWAPGVDYREDTSDIESAFDIAFNSLSETS